MLSIQEMVARTEQQRRLVESYMDGEGEFHPQEASIFADQKASDYYELKQSIHNTPLREFLAKSGTTGIMGAAYLVPDKVHDILLTEAATTDLVPLISRAIVTEWRGGDLKIDVADRALYGQFNTKGGGEAPYAGIDVMQPTLSPTTFTRNLALTDDLVDSAAFDLMEVYIQECARQLTERGNELALTVLKTATDGWGTVVGGLSGDANETKWTGATTFGVDDATHAKSIVKLLTDQRWIPDTMIVTTEAWEESILATFIGHVEVAGGAAGDYGMPTTAFPTLKTGDVTAGFDAKISVPALDIKFSNNAALHATYPTDQTTMSDCVTIIFNRANALLTGRKRWMRIDNYADPRQGLVGAVVSCRQDSVTLHDNCIGVITET
jgi:hypothetical protein